MRKMIAAATMGGLLLFAGDALAAGKGKGARFTPEQRAEMIDKRVKEKLAPKLGLDERAAARLSEVMRAEVSQRMKARQAVRQEAKALKALLERQAPAGELEAQMKKLQAARDAMPREGRLLEDTRSFLTAEQQAKLMLMGSKQGKHGPGKFHGKHKGKRHGKKGWNRPAPAPAPAQ